MTQGFLPFKYEEEQKGMKRREHGLGRGKVDSLAPGALWEVRGGSLGDEGRFSRRQITL